MVAGKVIAGPHVRNACRRHLQDLEDGPKRGLTWDSEALNRALGFFPDVLRLTGGQFEGEPFKLHPPQEFIVGSIFGWKRADGTRRYRRAYVEQAKGAGKALALDTPIATPHGWSTMGALAAGDWVFDDKGRPCQVTATSEIMEGRPCYRLEFSDGASVVADAGHLWRTSALSQKGKVELRTTQAIYETLEAPRVCSAHPQAKWNHRVDVAGPLAMPSAELPIPPYTLGAWLGDGDSDSARLTVAVADWDIVENIKSEGIPVVEQRRHAPHIARVSLSNGVQIGAVTESRLSLLTEALAWKSFSLATISRESGYYTDRAAEFLKDSGYFEQVSKPRGKGNGGGNIPGRWRVKPEARDTIVALVATRTGSVLERLRACGLLGNKHIPAEYMRASVAQRLALLRGILDTDGHCDTKGRIELTLCNRRLAFDCLALIRSLGFKAAATESAAKLRGVEVNRRWRICFQAYEGSGVFGLPRKQARLRPKPKSRPLSQGRMIVACEPVPSVPVKCISVDSPSRMFLAGEHLVPTHNSPLAGGIGLYMMVADGEARAEIYAAASKKDQAMVLFRDAVAMRQQSHALAARILESGKNPVWQLTDIKTNSFFKPLANEDGQSGPRPSCGLLDEIHEMADRLMINMIERGFKWRTQPLLFMITNSGHDKRSVCYEQHEHAIRVAAGTTALDDDFTYVGEPIDDSTFSYVCALDKNDDPLEDESCWIKANPMLGVTMRHENLRDAVKQAKLLPGSANEVMRLNFCVWTESDKAWMSRRALEACIADLNPQIEHEGAEIYLGLDLSAKQDLTALAAVVETGVTRVENPDGTFSTAPTYDAWVEGWTPLDTIRERSARDRAPYDVWHKQGFLNASVGKLIREDDVAAYLAGLQQFFTIKQLAYDQYSFARFAEKLDEAGVIVPLIQHPQGGQRKSQPPPEEIEEAKRQGLKPGDKAWPQGLWMPGSLTMLETLVLEGRIRFRGNPALISAFMSAVVQTDTLMGNRWLSKAKATNRIDMLIALLMAVGAATRKSGVTQGASVYESADFFM